MTPAGPRSLAVAQSADWANGEWGLPANVGSAGQIARWRSIDHLSRLSGRPGSSVDGQGGVEGPSSSPAWDEISASPHRVQGSSSR